MSSMKDSLPASGSLKKSEVAKLAGGQISVDEFLHRMVNINDVGIFHDPNCEVCHSPHRKAAEDEWLSSRNAEQVRQLLIDKGETFSVPVLKNHMEFHVDQSQVELRKREYVDKIAGLSRDDVSTLDRLQMTLAAVNERMVTISALEDPAMPHAQVEKIKADSTVKLTATMKQLLEFRAKMLGEMRENGEVFTIDKDKFVKTFGKLLDECVTDEEKLVVNKVFGELGKICKEY